MNEQEHFNINQFPKGWGMLVFPISMTRISNSQNAQACFEFVRNFTSKVVEPKVGIHFLYTEGLYMNMLGDAYEIKNSYAGSTISHANAFRKLLKKHHLEFQIPNAFSFNSWFQMYLSHPDFLQAWRSVEQFYEKNEKFQQLIKEDTVKAGKVLDEHQVAFFLEEHTLMYLLLNRQFSLQNNFVDGREEWILPAYPGSPPLAQIYLVQQDPLKIGSAENPYKGQYDLDQNKFIDYLKVQL